MHNKAKRPAAQSTHSATLAFALLISMPLGVVPPEPAHDHDQDHVTAREALRKGEILPLPRILAIAQAAVPGDVILVRLIQQDFGWRYRVRILAYPGYTRLVRMDASTGHIIEVQEE